MAISIQQLQKILPNAGSKAGVFVPGLNATMGKFAIITRLRMAAFLAQIGHESGQLQYVRELGNDKYLSKYDTGRLAQRLGNTPAADGDGQLYRGRGLIQVTGRFNYEACSEALFGRRIVANIESILVERLAQRIELGPRRLDLRFADLREEPGRDETGQHADDHHHHQQFEQGEAALTDPGESAWQHAASGPCLQRLPVR